MRHGLSNSPPFLIRSSSVATAQRYRQHAKHLSNAGYLETILVIACNNRICLINMLAV
jgi:hypothetical protein